MGQDTLMRRTGTARFGHEIDVPRQAAAYLIVRKQITHQSLEPGPFSISPTGYLISASGL